MDQATALLAALRASAALSAAPLTAARVEAMATTLGLDPTALPALIAELQRSEAVALEWGGTVRVLPEKATNGGISVGNVGAGAVVQAGHHATMGNVNTGSAAALGQIAALLAELRAVKPTLSGEAHEAAGKAEAALAKAAAPETPTEERKGLVTSAQNWLRQAWHGAPNLQAVTDLGERIKGFLT